MNKKENLRKLRLERYALGRDIAALKVIHFVEENERVKIIKNMLKNNQSPEFISSMVSQPLEYIYQIQESMRPVVCEENKYVVEEKNIDKTDS